jgi:hypothetical protein
VSEAAAKPSAIRNLTLLVGIGIAGWLLFAMPEVARTFMKSGVDAAGLVLVRRGAVLLTGLVNQGFVLGVLAGLLLLAANREKGEGGSWMPAFGLLSSLPLMGWIGLSWLMITLELAPPPERVLLPWVGGAALGLFSAWVWLRYGVGLADLARFRLTRNTRLERNRRTDVRELDAILPPEIGHFGPLRYVDIRRGYFVGLDERRKPIYLAADDWRLSHILLSGRTRSGKGVAAQVLSSQAIARGEFVIVFDPKDDEWMPHVLHDAATKAGQPYHFVDLRPGRPAQINPFAGCDEETIEAMLIGAFSLAEKGEAADFYRLADRKAAREAARFLAGSGKTAAECLASLGEVWLKTAPGFHAAMEEMADLAAVNAVAGLDIEAMARTGGCLYVVGDMGNTRVVRMQRMLMVRLMMMAKRMQAQEAERRLMTVFADEFKVHISRPFMASLGASAGWGMHCILAFQSLQDLADVPADLDRESVRGAVMENCAIQFSYRIKDPDTAEWLAASTGTILVDDEVRKVERNLALAETVRPERTIRQAERFFVDENMLMNMPTGCGVLVGATKLPAFCYTSPVVVVKRDKAREIVASEGAAVSTEGRLTVQPILSDNKFPDCFAIQSTGSRLVQPPSGIRAKRPDDEDFL